MNIAVVICYSGRNQIWLLRAIDSLKSKENKVDFYIHLDGNEATIPKETIKDNVVLIPSDRKVGPSNGSNKCFIEILARSKSVRYDYIARMDDDDICSEERIDHQVQFLQANPNIDFCGTLASVMDENANITLADWHYAEDTGEEMAQRFLNGGCHIVHASSMFKASMLYDYGHLWYNSMYHSGEDYDLWFKLLKQGYRYKLLPERLYFYRQHSRQITKDAKQGQRNILVGSIYHFYKQNWDLLCY